jgi:DNA-binding MarR family transcriptional regulator
MGASIEWLQTCIFVRTNNHLKTHLQVEMKLYLQSGSESLMTATDRTILNILQTSRWIQSQFNETLAPFGITLSQFKVLRIIEHHHPEPMTCGEIRNAMLERGPDLTRLLNRLERRELVSLGRSKSDARSRQVRLTDTAISLIENVAGHAERASRNVMRGLSIDERRLLSDLLERLRGR